MIVWKRDLTIDPTSVYNARVAALAAMRCGKYVLMSWVPQAGWSVAVGTFDPRATGEDCVVTNLIEDRHVKICAFSKPDGGDNPDPGGPSRAA